MSKLRRILWIVIGAGVLLNPAVLLAAPSAPDQTGWPWTSGGASFSHVYPADVDYNGDLELVFVIYVPTNYQLYVMNHDGTTLTSWPIAAGYVNWPPSLADVDGDGALEILIALEGAGGYGDRLRCYKYDGTILWTVQADCCFRSFRTPAIADVNLDGTLDVFSIAADDIDQWDMAYLLEGATGGDFTNWPIDLTGYGRQNFYSLTDVDSDEDLEIIIYGREGFDYDGSGADGYPKSETIKGTVADIDSNGNKDWGAERGSDSWMGGFDMDTNPLTGWPQGPCGGVNPIPSVCDVGNDGFLEIGFATISGCADSLLYNYDGTPVTGWPVDRGNFGSSDEMLIGDTDGDGLLNFINGATEGDFTPDAKIVNYKEDGTSATGFPWDFLYPGPTFGPYGTGFLSDIDLDGDVELAMISDLGPFSPEPSAKLHIWDLPVFYNPLNMHWRMAGGNMQHTGEWHPPSYYVPQVNSLSPALTWVTSCPVGTLQCSGASFESKPFVWFVPSTDAPDFYGGDLSKGIPAVAVAQPQIHPVSGTPQNPLNATYIEITPPALALGSYELVIQNPTGIRNMVKPVITVTDDVNASQTEVGDTLMVDFGPTPSELTFDWGDVGNTEYVVIYDTAPDGTFGDEAGQTTTNSLTTESPAGTDLFFRVVGVNSCGLGP